MAGEGGQDTAKVLLLGPVTVIPQEYARLHCSSLDVELAAPRLQRYVELLVADAAAGGHAQLVTYRGGRPWVLGLKSLQLPRPAAPLPRAGGTYLVACGSGGVGLCIVQRLANVALGARLAQLWRGVPAAVDVERLRRAGVQMLCLRAKVADAHSLHAALATVRALRGAARRGARRRPDRRAGHFPGRARACESTVRGYGGRHAAPGGAAARRADGVLRAVPLARRAVGGGARQSACTAACALQDAWAQQAAAAGAELGQVFSIGRDHWEEAGRPRGAQATAALGRLMAPAAAEEAYILFTLLDTAAERARSCGFQVGVQPPRASRAPARPQG